MEEQNLTQTVEIEYVKKNSLMSGAEILIPQKIYESYTQNNTYNKPKFGLSFPGGYITARGGVFKSHKEFEYYTFIRAVFPFYKHDSYYQKEMTS